MNETSKDQFNKYNRLLGIVNHSKLEQEKVHIFQ